MDIVVVIVAGICVAFIMVARQNPFVALHTWVWCVNTWMVGWHIPNAKLVFCWAISIPTARYKCNKVVNFVWCCRRHQIRIVKDDNERLQLNSFECITSKPITNGKMNIIWKGMTKDESNASLFTGLCNFHLLAKREITLIHLKCGIRPLFGLRILNYD